MITADWDIISAPFLETASRRKTFFRFPPFFVAIVVLFATISPCPAIVPAGGGESHCSFGT
jgi:hypothetical protein